MNLPQRPAMRVLPVRVDDTKRRKGAPPRLELTAERAGALREPPRVTRHPVRHLELRIVAELVQQLASRSHCACERGRAKPVADQPEQWIIRRILAGALIEHCLIGFEELAVLPAERLAARLGPQGEVSHAGQLARMQGL